MPSRPPSPSSPPAAAEIAVNVPVMPACRLPQWRSDELLGGAREARIEHHGAVYRLRLTALGKLILTK